MQKLKSSLSSCDFHFLHFSEGQVAKKYRSGPLCKSEHAVGTVCLAMAWHRRKHDRLGKCMHRCLHTVFSNKDTIFFSFEYTLPFSSFPVSDIVCDSLPHQSTTVRNWRMREFLLPPTGLLASERLNGFLWDI